MPTAVSEPPDSSLAYRQRVEDLFKALGTDERRGLTGDEAQSRLEHYGRNELAAEKPVPAWTVGLTARDWGLCVGVASTVLSLREGSKLIARMSRRRHGAGSPGAPAF